MFSDLWDKFVAFITSIVNSFYAIMNDVVAGILDVFMSFANTLTSGFSLGLSYLDITSYLTALPTEITQVMGLIGVTQCSTMIATSLGIRLILQLIPFTRLGS